MLLLATVLSAIPGLMSYSHFLLAEDEENAYYLTINNRDVNKRMTTYLGTHLRRLTAVAYTPSVLTHICLSLHSLTADYYSFCVSLPDNYVIQRLCGFCCGGLWNFDNALLNHNTQ